MVKRVFSIRLDDDIVHRLVTIALQRRLSRGHYGIEPPGHALAEALANADAPWVNGNGAPHD